MQYNSLIKLLESMQCGCLKAVSVESRVQGSCILFKMRCKEQNCDYFTEWSTSERCVNGGFTSNRALIASFALFGGTFTQFSEFASVLGCPAPTKAIWFKFCKSTLSPAVQHLGKLQEKRIRELVEKYLYMLVIGHDVRHDHVRNAENATAVYMAVNLYNVIIKMDHAHVLEVRDKDGQLSQASTNLDAFLTELGLDQLFDD